jgi:hypothetical protein
VNPGLRGERQATDRLHNGILLQKFKRTAQTILEGSGLRNMIRANNLLWRQLWTHRFQFVSGATWTLAYLKQYTSPYIQIARFLSVAYDGIHTRYTHANAHGTAIYRTLTQTRSVSPNCVPKTRLLCDHRTRVLITSRWLGCGWMEFVDSKIIKSDRACDQFEGIMNTWSRSFVARNMCSWQYIPCVYLTTTSVARTL